MSRWCSTLLVMKVFFQAGVLDLSVDAAGAFAGGEEEDLCVGVEDAFRLRRQATGLSAHLVHGDEDAVKLLQGHQEVVHQDADVSVIHPAEDGHEGQGVVAAERVVGGHRNQAVRRDVSPCLPPSV
jgi:hypothetical protein